MPNGCRRMRRALLRRLRPNSKGLFLICLGFAIWNSGSAPLGCCGIVSRALARPLGRGLQPELQTEPSLTVGLVPRQHTNGALPEFLRGPLHAKRLFCYFGNLRLVPSTLGEFNTRAACALLI